MKGIKVKIMAESIASSSGSAESSTDSTATAAATTAAGGGTSTDEMDVEGQPAAEVFTGMPGVEGQQAEEGMPVQVEGGGGEQEQGEDMVIEAGPSHIGKRVKVNPTRPSSRSITTVADIESRCMSYAIHHGSIVGLGIVKVYMTIRRT